MNMWIIFSFILYLAALALIVLYAQIKTKRQANDFSLGSRSLGSWVTALAAHASDMSGWLFMAFPAAIYTAGLLEVWTAVSLTFFMYLNWKFVAPKIRVLSEQYKSVTLSSFLEKHFADATGTLRIISALLCLYFFMFYISANLVALGRLFESAFGLPYIVGISIGVPVVFYVLLGGFLSISWIDFFQGLFLLGAIILVPAIAFSHIGGCQSILDAAAAKNVVLNLLPNFNGHDLTAILASLVWGLGYFGQPHIITKFMGISDVKLMKKAQYIGLSWQMLTLTAAACVGLIGIAFFPAGLANPEFVFIAMVQQLFHPFFAGLILCAILATAINVMGAQVLVSASVLAEDFYRHRMPNIVPSRLLLISRLSVLTVCACSFIIALCCASMKINTLVFYAWTGLGCTFGPLMILALNTKLRSRRGAIFSLIAGGSIAAIWPLLGTGIPAMLPGFIGGFAGLIVASWCEK